MSFSRQPGSVEPRNLQIEPLNREPWAAAITGPCALSHGVFQTPDWMDFVLSTEPEATDCSLSIVTDRGAAVLLPLVRTIRSRQTRYWSQADGVYGGLLGMRSFDSDCRRAVESHLFQHFRPLQYVPDPLAGECGSCGGNGCEVHRLYTHVLELTASYEEWFEKGIRAKCRNQIRSARKQGVEIQSAKTSRDTSAYYAIYRGCIDRWKLPDERVRSLEYFQRLLQVEGSRLYLAVREGVVMAGAITLECPLYTMYYRAALDKSYSKFCPTYALLDCIVRDSYARGARFLNLGASGGMRDVEAFKDNFGATRRDYSVYFTSCARDRIDHFLRYYIQGFPSRVKAAARKACQLPRLTRT